VRIRQTDKIFLDFKEIIRKSGGFEIRSELKNIETGLRFLNKLGFEEAFTCHKERELYSYKDLEICLDNIEELGEFIEIEKTLDSDEGKEKARGECIELLNQIAPKSEIIHKKYGDLMQDKINRSN